MKKSKTILSWNLIKDEIIGELGTPKRDEHEKEFADNFINLSEEDKDFFTQVFEEGEIKSHKTYWYLEKLMKSNGFLMASLFSPIEDYKEKLIQSYGYKLLHDYEDKMKGE